MINGKSYNQQTSHYLYNLYNIKGAPLPTKPGSSLIILLQTHSDTYRHNFSTDTFLFISHTTNVLLFKSRCNIFIGDGIIKELPGLVGSGTSYIYVLIKIDVLLLRPSLHFTTLHPTTLHSTSLHLSTLKIFPFKLHPTTLHYICRNFKYFHLNFTQLHFTTLHYPLVWLNPI